MDTDEKFMMFSSKMRFMNIFMMLTIAAMHISYNAGGTDFLTNIMQKSSGGSMAFFFFMSAFWYFKDYNFHNAGKKFKKRLKTLLIPYILWNTILFLEINGKSIVKNGSICGYEKSWLISLLFTRFNGMEYMPIDGPLWYIIRLLSYFLIAPIIYFGIKDKRAGIVSIIVCFIITRNGLYYFFDGWLCLFMIGAYVGLHCRKEYIKFFTKFSLNGSHKIVGVFGIVILYALFSIMNQMFGTSGITIPVGFHYMIGYLMAAIPLLFFDVPQLKPEVGGYSFVIYCSHMVLIPLFNRAFGKVNVFIPVAGGPWAVVLLVGVCVFAVALCKVLHRISPELEVLFTGGR